MDHPNMRIFTETLDLHVRNTSLARLVLSGPRDRNSELRSITVTLIRIKKGVRLNFVYRNKTNDITKNFDTGEGMVLIRQHLEADFLNADLYSGPEHIRMFSTPQGKVKLRADKPDVKPVASLDHDRRKERIIGTENNIYLRETGILNDRFEVRHDMTDKYLQVNRYIEMMAPFLKELPGAGPLQVADMGSGKGYLTFALYDYLTASIGRQVVMTGVETKRELVDLSNRIAEKAGFGGLKFVRGTIRDAVLEPSGVLIALHACDTATDDAIYRGITGGASLIVCAPCCHKQLRKEFSVTNELKGILKHGILEERQSEILTDGIRALILEAYGYKTKVFEFISTEHTPKNVMIVGQKKPGKPAGREKILGQIRAIREFYGIGRHYLEDLMAEPENQPELLKK
jgi:SAM-dependent methyltransferase